jgi:hypothetical protein
MIYSEEGEREGKKGRRKRGREGGGRRGEMGREMKEGPGGRY